MNINQYRCIATGIVREMAFAFTKQAASEYLR
jgi:hypothetical protein